MPARLRPLMTKFSFYENKNPLLGAGFLFPNTQTVILKGAVFLQKSRHPELDSGSRCFFMCSSANTLHRHPGLDLGSTPYCFVKVEGIADYNFRE